MRVQQVLLFFIGLLSAGYAWSQPGLQGRFVEPDGTTPLIGVNISLLNLTDTTIRRGEVTDANGSFTFTRLRPGDYQFTASYIGYQTMVKTVTVARAGTPTDLGVMRLEQASQELETVVVAGVQTRSEQKTDTTEYNARAFKVNTDATTEDLVAKMPGVTVQGGAISAQGETVRRVTVDGQEFFGDDAAAALRNLPAEIVDRIQVFDRQSDQSRFTGFNDGNTEKTINIVTRSGMSNGQFGRIYGGYGTDDRYLAGANLSYFKGKRRVSVIGLFNNINQQNFSSQDILGVIGNTGGGPGGGRSGGGGGGRPGMRQQGVSASDYLVGQQNGISTTNAVGLNFSDTWGKLKVNASYFFNNSQTDNLSQLSRSYFLTETSAQLYDETNETSNENANNRISMRLEYTIDSMNSIIITPRISFQNNLAASLLAGSNFDGATDAGGLLLNETTNQSSSDQAGLSLNNSILYQHRFAKARRTISVSLNTDWNDRDGVADLNSRSIFYQPVRPDQLFDQRADNQTAGLTLSTFISYTEPIGKNGQLMINYSPSWNQNDTKKLTNQFDDSSNDYTLLDTILSNQLENEVLTQRAGARYRYSLGQKMTFAFGADVQRTELTGDQTFPTAVIIDKTFDNLLPSAFLTYSPARTTNLRVFYRSFTNVPSVSQLQNVVDNSNPLLLSTGNANLRQQLNHSVSMRLNKSIPTKGHTFFLLASATRNSDYIGNSTLIALAPDTLQGGIILQSGAQLSSPVNLDGAWNAQTFATYGLPLAAIKSNLNLNLGLTYRLTPGLINDALNEANTYNANSGVVLSSNISQNLDFNVSYNATYNIVQNTLQPELDNNYFYHAAGLRFNWIPWKGLRINTDLTQSLYTGLGEGFNQDFTLWNAAIGYKFLKNKAAEISLSVFDILGQNTSINRNVTETYVEDSINRVLSRYFMLNFTYNLRNFGTPPAGSNTPGGSIRGDMPPPPGGGGMPHGGR